MADIQIKKSRLIEYRDKLEKRKNDIIFNITELRQKFISFEWTDNIHALAKQTLNQHITTLNKLLTGIDQAISNINNILSDLKSYEYSV